MKLNQMIDLNSWKAIGDTTFNEAPYNALKNSIMGQLYFAHGERELRNNFTDREKIEQYVFYFMSSNKQKLIYILDTCSQDFLSQDSTTITNSTDESNAFNTDYYGGEGKTGKDTSTGDTTTTNKAINNKDKSRNFYDVADNYLFRQMMNVLCETFTIDEEIKW